VAEKRDLALDGLRAVGIAAVVAFHYKRTLATGGSLGVDVFFVMSGWLITSQLLRAREVGPVAWGPFVWRRVLRLAPPLLVLLAAYVAAVGDFAPRFAATRWEDAAVSLAFVSNLRETFWPRNTPLSHLWFLSLQVQFYLIWPPVVAALVQLGRQRAALALLAAWGALTAARVAWHLTIGGPGAYYFTPLHATGLVLGSALAFRPMKAPLGWPALAVLLGLIIFGHTDANFLWLQPFAEIATLLILVDPPKLLAWPPLPFLGRISYGIYLWHVPFMWITFDRSWGTLAVLVAASIAAGWASARFVERPLDRARRRAPA
jgi:peptidoglycan/LPS O-acetylase OafA/YrhL